MDSYNLYRITNRNDAILPEILQLYIDTFPEDERRNREDFLSILDSNDKFYCHAILKENGFVGLINLWELSNLYYCEHFAIAPGFRNDGIGGKVLQHILKEGFAPLLCEVEPPEDAITLRRVEFYRRNGFILHEDIGYLQPPYSKEKKALPMRLMTFNFPEDKMKDVVKELREVVYKCSQE